VAGVRRTNTPTTSIKTGNYETALHHPARRRRVRVGVAQLLSRYVFACGRTHAANMSARVLVSGRRAVTHAALHNACCSHRTHALRIRRRRITPCRRSARCALVLSSRGAFTTHTHTHATTLDSHTVTHARQQHQHTHTHTQHDRDEPQGWLDAALAQCRPEAVRSKRQTVRLVL
jgi:hypothetical protein